MTPKMPQIFLLRTGLAGVRDDPSSAFTCIDSCSEEPCPLIDTSFSCILLSYPSDSSMCSDLIPFLLSSGCWGCLH